MSVETGKVCCNCRHNIRIEEDNYVHCHCEIKDKNMGYIEVMEGWCRRWASDEKLWKERGYKEVNADVY